MKKTTLLTIILMALVSTAAAQEDVTKFYLTNYGFDTDFDHVSGERKTVSQEIKEIPGWTAALSADYTVTGVYEFGFSGTFNSGKMPAQGYDGEPGGALVLSTGWEQTFCYYQTITLPKGTYTISVPTYNGKASTGGTSQLAWIPSSGTSTTSSIQTYPAKQWTMDEITFTLTRSTTGKLQIGYKAVAGGSASSANLVIDYVKITATGMSVSKTTLRTTITSAKKLYGTGEGTDADKLQAVIDMAQGVYDNSDATMPQVLEAVWQLKQAMEDYRIANASEDNPLDRTELITNPSFETNGTSGWTVKGLSTQSNSTFSRKAGTYYLESWVSIGEQIDKASVVQSLKKLPRGKYRLTASALHIQQTGSGSTTNKGEPQTGAYLIAGTSREEVTAMKVYTFPFAVLDETEDIEIGLIAENATGNWLCVDNFKLEFVGTITVESYISEVQKLVDEAQTLLDLGVQQTAADALTSAISTANTALQTTDIDALTAARAELKTAIAAGENSRALYDALKVRIDYAQRVVGWWEDVERKATAVNNLRTAIQTAQEKLTDYSLTDSQLKSAVNTLNTRISSVDKKIYCSTNACGTDEQLKVSTNQWCYDRSMQSKHWILFWEAGYGLDAPASVKSILANADEIFELYADSLKFITINQGKSKSDTYKMIIRLRYTEEWEASGSGIDDQIGLLTLSRWAYTSRGGQTVAHEIGHCFQYQVHCDNGNWNGWMYNWGNSTLNVFWEMCAQWQAYKYYPEMQFDNEWLGNTLNGLHRHPLCVDLRYNNYFIQDYICHKHGMDAIAMLWNKSQNPEDPFQAYMRLTMDGTSAEKLSQLGDEMWEYGARMTTFDCDPIREYGASTINKRNQTNLTKDGDGYWSPTATDCIENWGNNAIRLNVPSSAKTVYVEFEGQAGKDGYTAYNTNSAGWRYGFVALQKDGTRVYGDIGSATYSNPEGTLAFECPSNCKYLWLVVSGAPTSYWTRDWLSWSEESIAEQWPYRVKLHQTNIYGQPNNNTYPTGIADVEIAETTQDRGNVYSISGHIVRRGTTSLDGLPRGLYIVAGKKVMVR